MGAEFIKIATQLLIIKNSTMKDPVTHPTNHRLIYGIFGILVFVFLASLFIADQNYTFYITAALLLHITGSIYILMLIRNIPPPPPNPRKLFIFGATSGFVLAGILSLLVLLRITPLPDRIFDTVLIVTLLVQVFGLVYAKKTIPPPIPNPR